MREIIGLLHKIGNRLSGILYGCRDLLLHAREVDVFEGSCALCDLCRGVLHTLQGVARRLFIHCAQLLDKGAVLLIELLEFFNLARIFRSSTAQVLRFSCLRRAVCPDHIICPF